MFETGLVMSTNAAAARVMVTVSAPGVPSMLAPLAIMVFWPTAKLTLNAQPVAAAGTLPPAPSKFVHVIEPTDASLFVPAARYATVAFGTVRSAAGVVMFTYGGAAPDPAA